MELKPETGVPADAADFLARAGWGGATIAPLDGDASFRRYFRITGARGNAMLMDAPPPQEDPVPYLRAAKWLDANGMRAPQILAEDAARGFVLIEDFGDIRMREYLDAWPADEHAVYTAAVDALVQLHKLPPGPFTAYGLAEYLRETRLFVEWWCPAQGLGVDAAGWDAAWQATLSPLLSRQRDPVSVLRDYHAENIMLLGGIEKQGLLDFQDALAGHRAYDLVSLLQDARRDVTPEVETAMITYYLDRAGDQPDFRADYARLGAQRNAKIVGIFVRLWQRDGKARYLDLIPRVWALLERDLAHEALAPVAAWFADNVPAAFRASGGGSYAA